MHASAQPRAAAAKLQARCLSPAHRGSCLLCPHPHGSRSAAKDVILHFEMFTFGPPNPFNDPGTASWYAVSWLRLFLCALGRLMFWPKVWGGQPAGAGRGQAGP